MNRSAAVRSSLVALILTLPLSAQIQKPHPMTEKYRDAGAKPAGGRSGLASLQTRALLGRDGTTELQVTTGTIEPPSAPIGSLAKVQVKLLTDGGDVLQTDNYRKTLTGAGSSFFYYDGLRRGQSIQTQANVTGIDPTRTDVVTVSTTSVLRPDVTAASLSTVRQARVHTQVSIAGVMNEINGDVGARATCRLFADGVEIGSIPGAWVDAQSSVTCHFETTFTSAGTKRLAFRVTDVGPGDDDASNNEATASIEIVDTQPFRFLHAWAWDYLNESFFLQQLTFTRSDGSSGGSYVRDYRYRYREQSRGAYGDFRGTSPLDSGAITLTEWTDGTAIGTTTVNVSDLPSRTTQCASGQTTSGAFVRLCAYPTATQVWAWFHGGEVTYHDLQQGTGFYGWVHNYDTNVARTWGGGAPATLGAAYTAELKHESTAGTHVGRLDVVLVERSRFDYDPPPYCWSYTWSGYGTEDGCSETHRHFRVADGYAYRYE